LVLFNWSGPLNRDRILCFKERCFKLKDEEARAEIQTIIEDILFKLQSREMIELEQITVLLKSMFTDGIETIFLCAT
jgi:hypothetical protein